MKIIYCGVPGVTPAHKVQIPGRKPIVTGKQELVPPAPTRILIPLQPCEVTEEAGLLILERWGRAGIVALHVEGTAKPDGQAYGSEDEQVIEGLTVRHDTLVALLQSYREHQAWRQSTGLPIQLPQAHHRAAMKEVIALKKDLLARDPILAEELKPLREAPIVDPMTEELAAFGITPKSMPMAPGVDEGLLGLTSASPGTAAAGVGAAVG